MAMHNPKGRANYEPNSWGGDGGPREDPERGFRSFAEPVEGEKRRLRSESFADHYSQARQFYISQTEVEQAHMVSALVFELSKVQRPDIRARMVSHLLNIDEDLAAKVRDGLGLAEMPEAMAAARPTNMAIEPSPALSILRNAPKSFAGRKVGILVSDGIDGTLFKGLCDAIEKEGATYAVVAPKVGGVTTADGETIEGDEKIDGGPSVVFDSVVLFVSDDGVDELVMKPQARDFAAHAFVHYKFIGYTEAAKKLLVKAGVPEELDAGFTRIDSKKSAGEFVTACRDLRFWDRQGA